MLGETTYHRFDFQKLSNITLESVHFKHATYIVYVIIYVIICFILKDKLKFRNENRGFNLT